MITSTFKSLKIYGIISVATLLAACSSHDKPADSSDKPVTVVISTPAKSAGGEILLSGKLESENTANLSTRVMGYITSITVKPGDRVAKGALLATISSQDMLAKKAQASAMIAEAEAAARNAGKDYARYQTLYKQQSVSAKELENVSLQNTSAQSRLEAARQMRNEVNAMLAYTQIRAPFAGVITQKLADEGSMASPGMPLLILEQGGNLRVTATVPESEVSQIKVGDMATVDVKSTGKKMRGKVLELSPSSLASGGQYLVKISVPIVEQKGLLSGMYVNVTLSGKAVSGQPASGNLRIPVSALVTRDQLTGVYVLNGNNTVSLRWLRIGKTVGNEAEILSGLNATERYVLQADGKLYNGAVVTQR